MRLQHAFIVLHNRLYNTFTCLSASRLSCFATLLARFTTYLYHASQHAYVMLHNMFISCFTTRLCYSLQYAYIMLQIMFTDYWIICNKKFEIFSSGLVSTLWTIHLNMTYPLTIDFCDLRSNTHPLCHPDTVPTQQRMRLGKSYCQQTVSVLSISLTHAPPQDHPEGEECPSLSKYVWSSLCVIFLRWVD